MSDIPTLRGYLNRNGYTKEGEEAYTLHVFCPYCQRFHTHGVLQREFHEKHNHRVAHCESGPLVEKGYYIKPWTVDNLKEILSDCRLHKEGE